VIPAILLLLTFVLLGVASPHLRKLTYPIMALAAVIYLLYAYNAF